MNDTSRLYVISEQIADKSFDYAARVARDTPRTEGVGGDIIMSTTSHKSPTRLLSEKAMVRRIHTTRAERDMTRDGLDKHHHEDRAIKARKKAFKTKVMEASR